MPNFESLLDRPAFAAEPPKLFPIGDYPGIIKKWEVGRNQNQKHFVRFIIKPTGWPEDLDPETEKPHVDVTTKQFQKDYYVNPEDKDSYYSLQQLCVSCGLKVDGRNFSEVLPELVGAAIIFPMQINSYTDKAGEPRQNNQVGLLRGQQ